MKPSARIQQEGAWKKKVRLVVALCLLASVAGLLWRDMTSVDSIMAPALLLLDNTNKAPAESLSPPEESVSNSQIQRNLRLFDLARLNEPQCPCTEYNDPFPASAAQSMRASFPDLIQQLPGLKIEIGPFLNPQLFGPDVKYFDVLDLEGLKKRAKEINYPSVRLVEIDYVSPTGDLTSIPNKGNFSLAFSSHVLEHQLDLVNHLNAVSDLLIDGGYYFLFVPDKRYCFDHAVSETSVADILDDYYNQRQQAQAHTLRSVLEHRALTQHNDAAKHWEGIHDQPDANNMAERVKGALMEFDAGRRTSTYVDVHNYQFTPQGLAMAVEVVHKLHLSPMKVHQVYETVPGQLEFCIVFKKCCPGQEFA